MTETTHYHLKKPAGNDFVGPGNFNDNADLIDAALHGLKEGKLEKDPNTGKLPEGMLPPAPTNVKTSPVDADWVTLTDTQDSNARKKLTWDRIKAALKGYFDNLYAAAAHSHAWSAITDKPSGFPPSTHTHPASDIASGTLSTSRLPTVPVAKGGTGASTAEGARKNLGACANALESATAAALGLTGDATVNDGLAKLALGPFKIGDTLSTVRTDLGDKWLLCNGSGASKRDYPTLGGLLGGQGSIVGVVPDVQRPVTTLAGCDYAGSVNIFAFAAEQTVYYTALPFGTDTWHTSVITTNSSMVIGCLRFLNGKWIAGGHKKETSSGAGDEYGYVFVNNSASFSGNWSANRVDSGDYFSVTDVTYGNGLYCISTSYYNSTSKMYYAKIYTSNDASSWTRRFSDTSNNVLLNNVVYQNNTFVALGGRKPDIYSSVNILVYSTNGTSWTYKDAGSAGSFSSAVYTQNMWFFGSTNKLFKTQNLLTSPTAIHNELTYAAEGVMLSTTDPDILLVYGYEYVSLYKVSTDTFSVIQKLSGVSLPYGGGFQYSGYFYLLQRSGEGNIYSTEYFSLPAVSISTLYTYIKAKE